MKRVHSSELLAEIGHFRNVLEQNGIACVVRNEQLSGVIGEVPFLECMPELWVLDDDRADEAQSLIADLRQDVQGGRSWRCPKCREENEPQFAACWNCGAPDPGDAPPA